MVSQQMRKYGKTVEVARELWESSAPDVLWWVQGDIYAELHATGHRAVPGTFRARSETVVYSPEPVVWWRRLWHKITGKKVAPIETVRIVVYVRALPQ